MRGTFLAFDTSAAHCAAVVVRDGAVLASAHRPMARGQAEALMPLLEALLADAGLGWSDLQGIGVGIGPGNFTGIRISVSAARGLALALGVPAIGISSFEMMQAAAGGGEGLVSLPAPRDMAYVQELRGGAPAGAARLVDPVAAHAGDWPLVLGHRAAELAAGGPAREAALEDVPALLAAVLARRESLPEGRPAPLYVRPADAAPPREGAPVLLP